MIKWHDSLCDFIVFLFKSYSARFSIVAEIYSNFNTPPWNLSRLLPAWLWNSWTCLFPSSCLYICTTVFDYNFTILHCLTNRMNFHPNVLSLPYWTGFFAITIVDKLSTQRTVPTYFSEPKSTSNFLSHKAWFVAEEAAIYYASVKWVSYHLLFLWVLRKNCTTKGKIVAWGALWILLAPNTVTITVTLQTIATLPHKFKSKS